MARFRSVSLFKSLYIFFLLLLISISAKANTTITVFSVTDSMSGGSAPFCTNGTLNVQFSVSQTVNAGIFRLELSDNAGSFFLPKAISADIPFGPITNTATIYALLPTNVATGFGYRLRVIQTNDAQSISIDNGQNLVIKNPLSQLSNVSNGLVAYFPLDGFATDESGNNNNGTVFGSVVPTFDRFGSQGKAMNFSQNGYISIPNTPSLQSPTTELAISAWVFINQAASNGWVPILAKSNTSAQGQYNLECNITSNILRISFSNGFTTIGYPFDEGKWYHICVTGSTNSISLFVNGILQGTNAITPSNADNSMPLELGRHTPGSTEYLNGKLDEVRLYNRIITSSEVTFLFNGGFAGSNSPACQGTQLQLRSLSLNNATYAWTGPNNFSSNQQNPIINNVNPSYEGDYSLTLTVDGCSTKPTIVKVLVPALGAITSVQDGYRCGPGSVPLGVGGGGQFYRWYTDIAATTFITGAIYANYNTPVLTQSANYFVAPVSQSGCEGPRVQVSAFINTPPVAPTISAPTLNSCSNDTITLTASGNLTSYTWRRNGVLFSPETTISTLKTTLAGLYTVSGISADGCTSPFSASVNVKVVTAPASLTFAKNSDSACTSLSNASIGINNTEVTVTYQAYRFNGTTASLPIIGNGSAISIPLGNVITTDSFFVKATVTGTNCYINLSPKYKVNIFAKPKVILTNQITNVCSGSTAKIVAAYEPGQTYNWTVISGPPHTSGPFLDTVLNITFQNGTQVVDTAIIKLTVSIPGLSGTCKVDTFVKFAVFPQPIPLIITSANLVNGVVNLCEGSNAKLAVIKQLGTKILWSTLDTTATITVNGSIATINVTATNIFGCKTEPQSVTIVSNLLPTFNLGVDTTLCQCEPYILNNNPSTQQNIYSWSGSGKSYLTDTLSTNPTFRYCTNAATTTQTFQLIAVATNISTGCKNTDTLNITVKPTVIKFAGPDVTVCGSDTAIIGSLPAPNHTYKWQSTPALPYLVGQTASRFKLLFPDTALTIKQYQVVRLATSNGCTVADTLNITIKPSTRNLKLTGPTTVCASQQSVVYQIDSIAPNTLLFNAQYSIIGGTIISQNLNTITVNWGATNPGRIYMTLNSIFGCSKVDSINITIKPPVISYAGLDAVTCSNDSVTVGTIASPNHNYQWYALPALPSITNLTTSRIKLAVFDTAITITQYLLIRTATLNSCSVSDTLILTVKPQTQNLFITGATTVCPSLQSVVYQVDSLSEGTLLGAVQWGIQGGSFTAQSLTQATVNWGQTNPAYLYIIPTSTFGCVADTIFRTVNISTLITPAIVIKTHSNSNLANQQNDSLCLLQAKNITYKVLDAVSNTIYNWEVSGGPFSIIGPSSQSTIKINWLQPGTYSIKVSQTSNTPTDTCFGTSASYAISILPSPDTSAVLSGPTKVCQGASPTYTLSKTKTGSRFSWFLAPPNNLNLSYFTTVPSSIVTCSDTGEYTITVIETNASNCIGTPKTFQFRVYANPVINTIEGASIICQTNANNINYNYSIPNAVNTTSIYNWSVIGGTIISGNNSANITVSWLSNAPNYNLTVFETLSIGCISNTLTKTISEDNFQPVLANITFQQPNVDFNPTFISYLSNTLNGLAPTKTLTIEGSITGKNWFPIRTIASSIASDTISTSNYQGANYFRLKGTDLCENILYGNIHNLVKISAKAIDDSSYNLSWNAKIGFGSLGKYQILRSVDGSNYTNITSMSDTNYIGSDANLGFRHCFSILSENSATGAKSYSDVACLNFTHYPKPANVISPNGDGYNDVWLIKNLNLYPNHKLIITNRWGQTVLNTSQYNQDFGTDATAGIYFYQLSLSDHTAPIKGWLQVLK